jgi:hypothetical protein
LVRIASWINCRRNFLNAQTAQGRLGDHFRGEFHSAADQAEPLNGRFGEAAQAAMKIVDRRAEKKAPDEAENRVTQIAMKERHGARRNPSLESVAHHDLCPGSQALHVAVEPRKIIAVVGVTHDDKRAPGCFNPRHQRGAISWRCGVDHSRARCCCNRHGIVSGPVVRDHDLTDDPRILDVSARVPHAASHGSCLVQARHEHGQFNRRLCHRLLRRISPESCRGNKMSGRSRSFSNLR